jgi:hypothetical protein
MGYFGEVSAAGMAAYLAGWGIFTAAMTAATKNHARTTKFIFASLTILFFLLAAGEFNPTIHLLGGYVGLICGASAIYTSAAGVINDSLNKKVLPI